MKKNLIILTQALLLALPLFSLAADQTIPETQASRTASIGGKNGRRRSPASQTPAAPRSSFVDADADGTCDICGVEPGKNTLTPGFVDIDNDGARDHCGTGLQGQGSPRGRNYVDADNNGACDSDGLDARHGSGHGRGRKWRCRISCERALTNRCPNEPWRSAMHGRIIMSPGSFCFADGTNDFHSR